MLRVSLSPTFKLNQLEKGLYFCTLKNETCKALLEPLSNEGAHQEPRVYIQSGSNRLTQSFSKTHSPEQQQLIFQFSISLGKRPCRCQRLFTEKQLRLLLLSSIPNTTKQVIDYSGAECSTGLAYKTVQHDGG